MSNFERAPVGEAQNAAGFEGLSKYPGLKETLSHWCNTSGREDDAPMSFSQVVDIMSDDIAVRAAVRDYLSDSDDAGVDVEVADIKRENLAWALVDALSARK